MRTNDLEILMVPGWTNSGPDHWQSRWQAKLKTARRVALGSWEDPVRDEWVANLVAAVDAATRPVLLVAHSLGVLAVAHAASRFSPGRVAGAFLVGLPDLETGPAPPEIDPAFVSIPRDPLPFPSVLVHSATDPYCAPARAIEFAGLWGSQPADAGDAGHINTASGHGPWPEGLLRLASQDPGIACPPDPGVLSPQNPSPPFRAFRRIPWTLARCCRATPVAGRTIWPLCSRASGSPIRPSMHA